MFEKLHHDLKTTKNTYTNEKALAMDKVLFARYSRSMMVKRTIHLFEQSVTM